MGRLTRRHGKHAVQIGGETRRNDVGWLKLADYEDMEEQGRLIELPCAVGDTVYRTILDEVYEYTVGSFLVDENGAWGMSLLFEQEEKKFAANMDCDNLGKTVFLTKEEAEAKLAELKGEKACQTK